MSLQINRVTNANIYVDGDSYLGRAEELELPTVAQIMAEHKALGMIGTMEFPSGIEKMEAKIKWASFYSDALKKFASPNKIVKLQARSSLEVYGDSGLTEEQPVVVFLNVQPKGFPLGTFKKSENVELESMLNVTYIKLSINGEDILEVDALNNIYKVDGVDIKSNYRANLGI